MISPRLAWPLALLIIGTACSDSTGPGRGTRPLKFIDIVTNLAPRSYSPTASCAVTADSTLYCWGSNRSNRLGLLSTTSTCPDIGGGMIECERHPVQVPGAPKLTHLAGGTDYFCGLGSDGTPYCWGHSQTSDGAGLDFGLGPTPLPGGLHLLQISAGLGYICGATVAGQGVCWGDYQSGVRGDPGVDPDTAEANLSPNLIAGLSLTTLVARQFDTCGLTTAGDAYCWGGDYYGGLGGSAGVLQLNCGPGWSPCTATPVAVAGGLKFVALTGGRFHFCGLTAGGDAWCWGPATGGALTGAEAEVQGCDQSGFPTMLCAPAPVALPRYLPWKVLVAGDFTTCGLIADGAATCWGNDEYGQAGVGGGPADVDHQVEGGHHFTVIAPGTDHTCGITSDSLAFCWGENTAGQLGDDTGMDSNVPVAVVGPAAP
jgi:alpha-tubulin suppressor-like RCC1 family protein